ncbi:MAG: LPXTG cell wall anchor domain-containing protein [Chloroflexi bacterium]|nr:LPXTG cell wall anchor domain-containing protein [Chloroflexota bacterium]
MGDVKGQGVNNVWFVVSPQGGPRQNFATIKLSSGMAPSLADASGRTLYMYTRDDPNKSNCTGMCALVWPPVLTIGAAKADMGVNPALLGLIQREDGSTQVTYKEMPLYYYDLDEKPGDIKGQAVGNVWWMVTASGSAIRPVAAAPAMAAPAMAAPAAPAMAAPAMAAPAPAVPAALPRTGEPISSALMALMGVAGVMATGVGAWARRRFTK